MADLKKRTLTSLYNARPAWLHSADKPLDAAVAAAYGWDDYRPGMADEEILARLLETKKAARCRHSSAHEAVPGLTSRRCYFCRAIARRYDARGRGNGPSLNIHLPIYLAGHIFLSMPMSAIGLFSALAHETRLRCLLLLLRQGELCVCELTHAIGASQPHISRHLGHLREQGLVVDRRAGLWIHYRVNPGLPDWVHEVLRSTAEGVGREEAYRGDAAALAAMSNRPGAPRCA